MQNTARIEKNETKYKKMHKKQNNPKTLKKEKRKNVRNSTLTHLSALCACLQWKAS